MAHIVPLWSVYETINEYGSRGKPVGYFTNEAAANGAAEKRGWYGGPGLVETGYGLVINGETFLLGLKDPITPDLDLTREHERIKAQGLAKLTPDERRALGVRLAGE